MELAKFVEGSSKLNLLLQNSRLPFSKEGIGYEKDENQNSYDIPANICRRCGRGNHIEAACKETLVKGLKTCTICDSKKHSSETCSYRSLHEAWVPMAPARIAKVRTNMRGPKKIWVPKSQIIPVADVLNRKAQGFKLVPGQWMLTTHDGRQVYVPRPPTK